MAKKNQQLPSILFAKQVINGILVRPDSRHVMQKAIDGYPVDVTSGNDYINLYHVFERMVAADKELVGLKLARQQIGRTKWRISVLREGERPEDVPLAEDYDPKRGRYKRYAEQLANDESLVLSDKVEAIKARRAWQLYVPPKKRTHLRSTIRRVAKTGKFVVAVLPKE